MYEKFEELLGIKGYTAADVTRITGISSTVFSEWKKGKSTPKTDKLILIARCLGTTVEYLMTGEKPEIPGFEPEHLELIELYSQLKTEQKSAVLNLLRSFAL
ncbi:MAG: helix-turn-helix domain-containing protein [Agathobacter sp.]|nr:helix-turn-helix domain-containing protein [Agathobacter sp.]